MTETACRIIAILCLLTTCAPRTRADDAPADAGALLAESFARYGTLARYADVAVLLENGEPVEVSSLQAIPGRAVACFVAPHVEEARDRKDLASGACVDLKNPPGQLVQFGIGPEECGTGSCLGAICTMFYGHNVVVEMLFPSGTEGYSARRITATNDAPVLEVIGAAKCWRISLNRLSGPNDYEVWIDEKDRLIRQIRCRPHDKGLPTTTLRIQPNMDVMFEAASLQLQPESWERLSPELVRTFFPDLVVARP